MSIIGIAYITIVGLILITLRLVKKLTPVQRAALAAIVIIASGTLIVLGFQAQAWGLALIAMFVLGWLLSEISRL